MCEEISEQDLKEFNSMDDLEIYKKFSSLLFQLTYLKRAMASKFDWRDIALSGDKITAVKMYRDLYGKTLRQSKEEVDEFLKRMAEKETV